MTIRLHGLVAATHTPFDSLGELQLQSIEKQAEHLARTGVQTVFICGSTGESHSLTVLERMKMAERWSQVVKGTSLRLVVHVGSNCLSDARSLAAHAQANSALAIAALAPSYFKPKSVDALIDCCAFIASAAPELPFYFYDIPSMTSVHFSMSDFLARAGNRVSTLAGIKFTNSDLMSYQRCLQADATRWDIPWGVDEYLLAALSLGAKGAVGSSYNFAAPIYQRIIQAFDQGDLTAARMEQFRSVQLIELLARFGYMAAAKTVMGFLGVPVGAPRLPNTSLQSTEANQLRGELEKLDFFNWIQ